MSDAAPGGWSDSDEGWMAKALAAAAGVRARTAPNPWVGCVVVPAGGAESGGPASVGPEFVGAALGGPASPESPALAAFVGATEPPGGPHAEVVALDLAGDSARGATVYVTLEPCSHHGRTPPCADALVKAGVARVVVGIEDPDPRVSGQGLRRLREAGVEVTEGVLASEIAENLAPYIKHRRTGRPWVVLKLASTIDGRIAAPDGSSQWLTGPEARADAHGLRAESDAILVGAGTVRADDPALTVRHVEGRDPLRVVLGKIPPGARVRPALELSGDLPGVLEELGRRGVLQVLVEGGATVAHRFHSERLVDRYVLYLAPAIFGGDDARPMFSGPAAPTVGELWRGRLLEVRRLGADLRIDLAAA